MESCTATTAQAISSTDSLPRGVVLFGPPGCGKGTIGRALGSLPGLIHLSSGDIVRLAAQRKGHENTAEATAAGDLISDNALWDLVDANLAGVSQLLAARGHCDSAQLYFVVDGIPRSRRQVGELAKRMEIVRVFYLECDDLEVLVQRAVHRFSVESRTDDSSLLTIRRRLRLFCDETLSILEEYPANTICRIDACQSPARVSRDVLATHDGRSTRSCFITLLELAAAYGPTGVIAMAKM